MKKFLAILLAAMMLLGMTCAFADGEDAIVNVEKITKKYTGALPVGDILTFEVTYVSGTDTQPAEPLVKIGDKVTDESGVESYPNTHTVVESADDETALTNEIQLHITPPTNYGAYTYKIVEKDTGNTNVSKVQDTVFIQVYNLQDKGTGCTIVSDPEGDSEDKNDYFKNDYAVGSVEVTKTISGNAANASDKFPTTITLSSTKLFDDMQLKWNGGDVSYTTVEVEGVYEYKVAVDLVVGAGDQNALTGVPAGMDVTFAENGETLNGYTPTYDVQTGTVAAGGKAELSVDNYKNMEIPTGVYVDYIPYVVLLAVAVLGLVAFVVKRRMAANNDD